MVGHPVGQAAIVKRGEDTRATRTVRERKCVARQFRPRMRPRSVLLFFFWHLTQCNPFTSGAPHPRDMSHDTPRDATTVVVCSRPVPAPASGPGSTLNMIHPEPHTRNKSERRAVSGVFIFHIYVRARTACRTATARTFARPDRISPRPRPPHMPVPLRARTPHTHTPGQATVYMAYAVSRTFDSLAAHALASAQSAYYPPTATQAASALTPPHPRVGHDSPGRGPACRSRWSRES